MLRTGKGLANSSAIRSMRSLTGWMRRVCSRNLAKKSAVSSTLGSRRNTGRLRQSTSRTSGQRLPSSSTTQLARLISRLSAHVSCRSIPLSGTLSSARLRTLTGAKLRNLLETCLRAHLTNCLGGLVMSTGQTLLIRYSSKSEMPLRESIGAVSFLLSQSLSGRAWARRRRRLCNLALTLR